MGVGIATAEFLAEGATRGVRYDRTITIGRQRVLVGPWRLFALLRRNKLSPGTSNRKLLKSLAQDPFWLEPFLRSIGAREIDVIDASAYEGANVVHDLNEPISDDLRERYTTVFDGGTLEHVFDVSTALQNYMEMVKVGGHLIIHSVANNYFGHGFYQFSAELFFRVLSADNGFEVERVVLLENDIVGRRLLGVPVALEQKGRWYEVTDPARVRSRVLLQTRRPVVVQVQARRISKVPIFSVAPQQSDYASAWVDGDASATPLRTTPARRLIARVFPDKLKAAVALDVAPLLLSLANPLRFAREARGRSFGNGRHYRRVARRRRPRVPRARSAAGRVQSLVMLRPPGGELNDKERAGLRARGEPARGETAGRLRA